ncbi:GerMN domain-containing protein [Paramaledivibacter caminithermalis]|uniref:Sporulation and spore germination n=1 Tax=Paramaledivibacter caminithermalis (strain DSM 15212 / CIP 107654 / DViRD3) TaxID=1121301 RepID=A0A1M6MH70_PARC5|nr:GerMN domain-containing protein [Paramaledivibacter caminithermalis]SHJ82706.1 Sporulation and spore germination [Paramaledivibacter caminithermalis DSM 15212]
MKSFYRLYVFLLIFCVVILLIVTFREDISISDNVRPIPPVPEEITSTFKLYFIDKDELAIENRSVTTKDIAFEKVIVEELINGPRNKTLLPTIPPSTKLLSIETIDKICYVNFSKDYVENQNWEEIGENLIIWSIVNSLTQLDYIQKVQILVEGEKIQFSHDEYSLNQPFSRNEELVKKSDVTYFSIIKDFLDSLMMERYDKAYSMLDKGSIMRIGFQEFRVLMDEYIKELRGYEIVFYNTQIFSDKTIVLVKYNRNNTNGNITFYQSWKLIDEDGQKRIVLGDREDYISRLNQ